MIRLKKVDLNICVVYRSQKAEHFSFLMYINDLTVAHKNCFFFGDFNYDLFALDNVDDSTYIESNRFVDVINSSGYCFLNDMNRRSFTHVSMFKKSCLDHVFTDIRRSKVSFVPHSVGFTDHRAIVCNIDINVRIMNEPIEIFNKGQFLDKMSEYLISPNSPVDVNELHCHMVRVKNSCKRVLRRKRSEDVNWPWVSDELLFLIKERDFWRGRSEMWRHSTLIRNKYKVLRNKVTRLSRVLRKNYNMIELEAVIGNGRKTFKIINEILGMPKNRSGPTLKAIKSEMGELVTDPAQIAEYLNESFVMVGGNIQTELQNTFPERESSYTVTRSCPTSIMIAPTNIEEVARYVDSLKTDAAAGYDELSPELFKSLKDPLTPLLEGFINKMFVESKFPDILKCCKVVPLYKGKGSKLDFSNYRPVSVPPIMSKPFEMAINDRLKAFYKTTNFFDKAQFGFVDGSNTTAAVLNLVVKVQQGLENKNYVTVLIADIRKAFDSVDHDILKRKLFDSGIRGVAYDLLADYLSNREQFVKVGSAEGTRKRVTHGIPQGSILGPLLFLVYINDLACIGLEGKLQMYADDTVIIYSLKQYQDLERAMTSDLLKLEKWFFDNKLSFNATKTKYILFGHKNKKVPFSLNLSMNGIQIEKVSEIEFLGSVLNEMLDWKGMVKRIRQKVIPFVGILTRVSGMLDERTKRMIYFAHVHSHLIYLNAMWNTAFFTHLEPLRILQNKAVRALYWNVYNSSPDINTDYIYDTYKIPKLKDVNRYHSALLVYQTLNGHLKNELDFNINVPRRSFRASIVPPYLNIETPRTEHWGRHGFMYHAQKVFNSIPENIRNINNLLQFKRELKRFVFSA